MSFFETMDKLIGDLLPWIWSAAVGSLIVFALLCALWPVIRKRVSTHSASWLWLLPIVPLALPFGGGVMSLPIPPALVSSEPEARTATKPQAITESDRAAHSRETQIADHVANVSGVFAVQLTTRGEAEVTQFKSFSKQNTAQIDLGATSSKQPSLLALVGTTWLILVGFLFARLFIAYRHAHRVARNARPCDDLVLGRNFQRLVSESGAPDSTRLLLVDEIDTPSTCGVRQPTVLLPTKLLKVLGEEGIEFALRHELAHVRRRDVLIEFCMNLVRAIWLFHPVAWLSPRIVRKHRELACDEAAVARGAAPVAAARALLDVIEYARSPIDVGAGSISLTYSKSQEKERIMNLLHPAQPVARGLRPFTSVMLFATAVLIIPRTSSGATQDLKAGLDEQQTHPMVIGPSTATPDDLGSSKYSSRQIEEAIHDSITFLVARQADDGCWRASEGRRGANAGEFDDVGVTALALLALHNSNNHSTSEDVQDAIWRGIGYLAENHDTATGAFSRVESNEFVVPSHALALTAWIKINAASDGDMQRGWREVAQRAIEFAESIRNPYQGWRYDVQPVGDNDSVITGWMLMALAEARDQGFTVDQNAIEGGVRFLDKMTNEETGHTGYSAYGAPTSRLVDKQAKFPGEAVELPTAVALSARLALDSRHVHAGGMLEGAVLLTRKTPQWNVERGTIDSYYWAFGTRAMQAFGGELQSRWNTHLVAALMGNLNRNASGEAWWSAMDAWHNKGSEVAMTAACTLALEGIR